MAGDDSDGAADGADGVDGALVLFFDFDVDLVREGVVVDVEGLRLDRLKFRATYGKGPQLLRGSFSAVSRPIFASEY